MVKTMRSTEVSNIAYESDSANGGVCLLVKPNVEEKAVEATPVQSESAVQAAERMQRNLYNLLNYDRFNAEQMQAEEVKEETVVAVADEDFRPTSTTMQFGDDNIDEIREEMKQSEHSEVATYHLNSKGKVVVLLYSLVVTVILALIVLNTGLLARLGTESNKAYAEYATAVNEYNAVMTNIENISSPDYIINVAQNDYGMVKR